MKKAVSERLSQYPNQCDLPKLVDIGTSSLIKLSNSKTINTKKLFIIACFTEPLLKIPKL